MPLIVFLFSGNRMATWLTYVSSPIFFRKSSILFYSSWAMSNRVVPLFFLLVVATSNQRREAQPFGIIFMHQAKVLFFIISYSTMSTYFLENKSLGDYTTRHAGRYFVLLGICLIFGFFAACPVLIGNKWVGNKWIHERGQEFRRRCSLDPMA